MLSECPAQPTLTFFLERIFTQFLPFVVSASPPLEFKVRGDINLLSESVQGIKSNTHLLDVHLLHKIYIDYQRTSKHGVTPWTQERRLDRILLIYLLESTAPVAHSNKPHRSPALCAPLHTASPTSYPVRLFSLNPHIAMRVLLTADSCSQPPDVASLARIQC